MMAVVLDRDRLLADTPLDWDVANDRKAGRDEAKA
jgi:hypothetical protein